MSIVTGWVQVETVMITVVVVMLVHAIYAMGRWRHELAWKESMQKREQLCIYLVFISNLVPVLGKVGLDIVAHKRGWVD